MPLTDSAPVRWTLGDGIMTHWSVDEKHLPHGDFIEQGGRRAGQIIRYSIDEAGLLSVNRMLVWPSLRIFPNDTHGSFIYPELRSGGGSADHG